MTPLLTLRDLHFTYAGQTMPALREVSFALEPGSLTALIGRAGAGKSTLCAACAGFAPHFFRGTVRGSIHLNGLDVLHHDDTPLIRHVALVGSNTFSQMSGARFTVFEEVGFALENLGLPYDEMIERIGWALDVMGIAALHDRSPYELSGGQQQRVALAAALALRPPLLVLDEPTAQLDPPATRDLAQLLRDLSAAGTTLLVAEHRLDWVAELAERVLVLHEGVLLADGPPATVLTDPRLRELEIGWPRPALIAEHARTQGNWPLDRPLPVTQAGLQAAGVPQGHAARPRRGSEQTAPADTVLVEASGLHYAYPNGVAALRGAGLRIGRGERVALLGHNGAGKSTLVRHLNGLLRPAAGQVRIQGQDIRQRSVAACARHVGIVFQDVRNQLFARTVRDELWVAPRNLGVAREHAEYLVARALRALNLEAVADRHPYDLPLALRRLTAIAAVLTLDSDLLILDEPTAGLDNRSIAALAALTDELTQQGKSVLIVSHDLDFCYETLDRVILMSAGAVLLDTTWASLTDDDRALLDGHVGLPLALRV